MYENQSEFKERGNVIANLKQAWREERSLKRAAEVLPDGDQNKVAGVLFIMTMLIDLLVHTDCGEFRYYVMRCALF